MKTMILATVLALGLVLGAGHTAKADDFGFLPGQEQPFEWTPDYHYGGLAAFPAQYLFDPAYTNFFFTWCGAEC